MQADVDIMLGNAMGSGSHLCVGQFECPREILSTCFDYSSQGVSLDWPVSIAARLECVFESACAACAPPPPAHPPSHFPSFGVDGILGNLEHQSSEPFMCVSSGFVSSECKFGSS